jgi:hypothetical protein
VYSGFDKRSPALRWESLSYASQEGSSFSTQKDARGHACKTARYLAAHCGCGVFESAGYLVEGSIDRHQPSYSPLAMSGIVVDLLP